MYPTNEIKKRNWSWYLSRAWSLWQRHISGWRLSIRPAMQTHHSSGADCWYWVWYS